MPSQMKSCENRKTPCFRSLHKHWDFHGPPAPRSAGSWQRAPTGHAAVADMVSLVGDTGEGGKCCSREYCCLLPPALKHLGEPRMKACPPQTCYFMQPSNPPKRQIPSFRACCWAPVLTVLTRVRTMTTKSYPNTCYKLVLAASYKVLLFITFTFWLIPLSSSPMSTILSSL